MTSPARAFCSMQHPVSFGLALACNCSLVQQAHAPDGYQHHLLCQQCCLSSCLTHACRQPAFSPAALSGYVPLMAASTDRLMERLHWIIGQKQGQGQGPDDVCIDMFRELGAMTLQWPCARRPWGWQKCLTFF
eukprot:217439-Pelagomonas_calceolata.AAC.1